MFVFNKIRLYFVVLLCLFVTACGQEDKQSMSIGTNIWPGYEPLYLARELEKWPQEKIHLVEYPSATEVLRAFRNQAIEAASLTLDEVLLLKQDGIPVTVVLVHDISAGGDVIMARTGIKNFKDLKGKRVALEANALGAFVITRALEKNDMTLDDIIIHNADINTHEALFKSGKIDAVVTFEPIRTKLLNLGAVEVFNSKQIPNEIVDVLVVHNDYLKEHPERVKLLVKDWFNAIQALKQSPDSSAIIISKRLQITPAEVIAGYEGLHIPDIKENHQLLNKKNAKLSETVKKLNRALIRHHLIKGEVDTEELFNHTYLPGIY